MRHARFLRQDAAPSRGTWTPVVLGDGEAPPPLEDFDALWVMGGPMDTWQEDAYPWLVHEKALIREAVMARGMPYLGFCLGHQLLACALGGACGPGTREIGVFEIDLTERGRASAIFQGVDTPLHATQWHGAEVVRVPAGAAVLARTPGCAVQAMQWGPHAVSFQFHIEADLGSITTWLSQPGSRETLEQALGPGSAERFADNCARSMTSFEKTAAQLFANWSEAARKHRPAAANPQALRHGI